MSETRDHTVSGSIVHLEGALTIACARQLKEQMACAIQGGVPISISLAHVSALDVTAYQLLWAAERKAHALGIDLIFTGPVASEVTVALAEAGLTMFAVREGKL